MNLPLPDSYACYKERLRCVCALHDGSTTSGARSGARNKFVGGSPNSKHQVKAGCMGDDIVLDDMGDTSRAACVRTCRTLGLIAVDERDHIHTQGMRAGPI